jgi:hypothetical protein
MENLTESHEMRYCKNISSKKDNAPSAKATFLFKETFASADPNATVTIKSKAFILLKVLLPEARSKKTIRKYAKIVMIKVRMMLSLESKKRISIKISFCLNCSRLQHTKIKLFSGRPIAPHRFSDDWLIPREPTVWVQQQYSWVCQNPCRKCYSKKICSIQFHRVVLPLQGTLVSTHEYC